MSQSRIALAFGTAMKPNEKIKARRLELGLSDVEVANEVGLAIESYFDIELHSAEITHTVELRVVKRICKALDINLFALLDLPSSASMTNEPQSISGLAKSEIVRKKREEIGYSREELGDRIGFFAAEIEKIETNPDHIETWPTADLEELAKEINIPLVVLIA